MGQVSGLFEAVSRSYAAVSGFLSLRERSASLCRFQVSGERGEAVVDYFSCEAHAERADDMRHGAAFSDYLG